MMGMAEAGEKAGSVAETTRQDDEFRAGSRIRATSSILNAEAFRKPYPLIRFRDFFPSDFYARLLQRFPDVDRFAGLNGDGTRREYALYDERSDPGSEESRATLEHRAAGAGVGRSRVGATGKAGRGFPHPRRREAARAGRCLCIRARCSTPTSTATRSSLIPTRAGRS